jgi:His-Xaa-Ser system protein HxsD
VNPNAIASRGYHLADWPLTAGWSPKTMKQEIIIFDNSVYSISAVKKAAYRFLDVFSATISTEDGAIKCTIAFPSGPNEERIVSIIDDFRKEVLDQDLREILKRETEQVRNLILAHAFSKTGIVME